ncbi:phospholipase D-like domain-containing anti-phage protein [Acidithrix sp. C25]|uniref:phospholipase D-like domain-containing anti-phage protein n=1 Tax=Acidithrix sp. C25 TaxID=1671482 RepID=UPI00191B92BC|nr:phospholipase D-like domain-containing anti-phage protein [Acidithrix sp. C25]
MDEQRVEISSSTKEVSPSWPSSPIMRYSSLEGRLDHSFLAQKLQGAKSYKRIAGYFRSSIFELVGEEIESIEEVKIVCNSELDASDIAVSKAAREVALKGVWNGIAPETEALLHRERYQRLYKLLCSGRVQIRVVPKDKVFVHGKAGVIAQPDGSKIAFLGSVNESKAAFAHNYEILWEDSSPEAALWVEAEFNKLWDEAHELPDAIITEIKRISQRIEVHFADLSPAELPAAAMVESPIYRGGEGLQPWQRSFVSTFLEHREIFGKARLLLADEVGLGKTLSMATAALVGSLLGDGPVLILCPATLTQQWQTELKDHLGIPSAVWLSNKKQWVDNQQRVIRGGSAGEVGRCPLQIGIVSTGLITHNSAEAQVLREIRFGTVILDEAHKARKKLRFDKEDGESNLRSFMVDISRTSRHVLLGTATPIQTAVRELWDLLDVISVDADFVFGQGGATGWRVVERTLPVITGESSVGDINEAWELIRSPLAPRSLATIDARPLLDSIRADLGLSDNTFYTSRGLSGLGSFTRADLEDAMGSDFFRHNNPFVRHVVIRQRATLEAEGLLARVGVNVHPDPDASPGTYGTSFDGLGLITNYSFERGYEAAEEFGGALQSRGSGASLFRAIFLQRICSSFASGLATVGRILDKQLNDDDEEGEGLRSEQGLLDTLTTREIGYLEQIRAELSRPEAVDPKLAAVKKFLESQYSEGRTWGEWGCIIFSQYFDTVDWIAKKLAEVYPDQTIAVYAGASKSGLYRDRQFVAVSREEIKGLVKSREVSLVVATDAACEGLNLQTLGTLINVDLPWNPSRLEQRLGRIKRFGQARKEVDMLNLVYKDTRDEKVYEKLSERMRDRYNLFGSIPDCIDDEWIDDIEAFAEKAKTYLHFRNRSVSIFEKASKRTVMGVDGWEECSKVLSRRDIELTMNKGWTRSN